MSELTRVVSRRLMRRSHEHPVRIATAAGGNRMAMRAMMISDEWTMVVMMRTDIKI
jgi:hypothetical protein